MAAGEDRLSGLHDDLLRRVLHFVPAKEGAFTTALSRRWRPLWPSSGAITLVARIRENDGERYRNEDLFYAKRDAFDAGAHAALDAFQDDAAEADDHIPVTKLTFRVEAHHGDIIRDYLLRYREQDVLAGVLSHPAARSVEELRIAAVESIDGNPNRNYEYEVRLSRNVGIYRLRLGSLPSETLRVLELTNCSDLTPASPPTLFPRLATLRLRHGTLPFKRLQSIVDAAPLLAFIHLESVLLEGHRRSYQDDVSPSTEQGALLRCPVATTLLIDRCGMKKDGTIEIYAPMLRRFEYKGLLRHISLSPPPPELARAEMTLIDNGSIREKDPGAARGSFWRFVHGFSHAKEVKLRVRHLEDIAVVSEASQVKLLPTLLNLERLELEGVYRPNDNKAAAAIANLLRCCPALQDLGIKLSTTSEESTEKCKYEIIDFLEMKYRSEFEESVRRSKRQRTQQPAVAARDKRDDVHYDEVSDLSGLTGHSFECLRSCLRRVGLQFRREEKDCFGVKLVKFFAENAKVMEKICIDAGNDRICDHLNLKIERWIADSSKRRRIMNLTKVEVLSLRR